jgi:membrane associated rhomboid family serine protease
MADRYQYRQYRFQGVGGGAPSLTPMVKQLLIAHGVVYLAQLLLPGAGIPLTDLASLRPVDVVYGLRIWQPFTYMWLHAPDSAMHILFNMFSLWMFGGILESVWGSQRFLRFYLQCGIGAGFIILAWNWFFGEAYSQTLGASGAIYGLLLAFSLLWPDRTIMLLFPPIPIKAIWFIPVMFAMNLMFSGAGNVSNIGHLGGVIVAGWIMRDRLAPYLSLGALRHRYHRWRMRNRLRAVRRDEWQRRNSDDDPGRPH